MEEYLTIAEAARQLGFTTKRIQRAIKSGSLEARYPHPNKAEISIADLLSWHATLHVRPGETQDRLTVLEQEMNALRARVATLESQLAELSSTGPRKPVQPPPAELKLPEDHVWLSDFADQHYVPRNEAQRLYV